MLKMIPWFLLHLHPETRFISASLNYLKTLVKSYYPKSQPRFNRSNSHLPDAGGNPRSQTVVKSSHLHPYYNLIFNPRLSGRASYSVRKMILIPKWLTNRTGGFRVHFPGTAVPLSRVTMVWPRWGPFISRNSVTLVYRKKFPDYKSEFSIPTSKISNLSTLT